MNKIIDGYISPKELELTQQLKYNIDAADKQKEIADYNQQKAHAEMRAAEAELRAAQAEYNSAMMRLLWVYKLEDADGIRQSDGFIMKGKNDEKNDTDNES